jgi:hypothetical protein
MYSAQNFGSVKLPGVDGEQSEAPQIANGCESKNDLAIDPSRG